MKVSFWLYYYCDSIFAKILETSIYGGQWKGTSSQVTDLAGNKNTQSSQRASRDRVAQKRGIFHPPLPFTDTVPSAFCKPLEELEIVTGYLSSARFLLQGQYCY